MCDGTSLAELYTDSLDGEIATEAFRLGELVKRTQGAGRQVPVSIERATGDLWRWAGGNLTPRGRQPVGPAAYDIPLPLAAGRRRRRGPGAMTPELFLP